MIKFSKKTKKYIREFDRNDFDPEKFLSVILNKNSEKEFQYFLILMDKIIIQDLNEIDSKLGKHLLI